VEDLFQLLPDGGEIWSAKDLLAVPTRFAHV
jgi:hypothetical protein